MKNILCIVGGVICLALSVVLLRNLTHPLWLDPVPVAATKVQGVMIKEEIVIIKPPTLQEELILYLQSKKSPLADYADVIIQQPNWKKIIAISAIESGFCTRKISYNCWGIGGDSAYRHYKSYTHAILDAEKVMEKYQSKSYSQMNGVYNQPGSKNWLNTTTKIDAELTAIEKRTNGLDRNSKN